MDFSASDVTTPITTGNGVSNNDSRDITQLASIFDLLDLEGNGDLDFPEFKVGLTSIGVNLDQDEANALFESIDAENEQYVNKDMFIEWLSKPSTSSQMDIIRSKLTSALTAAEEINNPIQDMLDEDEIANILGNKAEYIHEIEDIKNDNIENIINDDINTRDDSNGTTKINSSEDEDSMDSSERREIAKAKKKQERRNSKKFAQNQVQDSGGNLETSLMEKEIGDMMKQQKYALDRTVSGRNIYKKENASKWQPDEIDHEFDAMMKQHRRLSQASLTIDQVQNEANKTMEEFIKMSNTDNVTATPTTNVNAAEMSHNADTVGVPSKFDVDYDIMVDANAEPNIKNKILPHKIDTMLSPTNNIVGNGSNNISPRPIQEITTTGTPHTTSTQPVMIGGGGSQNNSRRNSLSYSYSMHSVSQSHGNNNMNNMNNMNNSAAAYVVSPNQGMTDISQYTAQHNLNMQQQLINNNNKVQIQRNVIDETTKNCVVRLFIWYLSSMHQKESLRCLWFHGANAVLSMVICFIMASLFVLAIAFIPLCGVGLIFIYFMCLLARHFAIIDTTFAYYFFGNKLINRFSIFIPQSHQQSIIGALKEYITDPHILQVILYFTFIKLPASFILSGITMVIFSGVTSILLSPLIFWLDKPYFEDDNYCLFGSKSYDVNDNVICNGWPINSFGETFIAFLVLIPTLPLTLHFSNFTAKLLIRITLNFLSINSPNSPMINKIQKQQNNINNINNINNNSNKVNVNYSLNNNGAYI